MSVETFDPSFRLADGSSRENMITVGIHFSVASTIELPLIKPVVSSVVRALAAERTGVANAD